MTDAPAPAPGRRTPAEAAEARARWAKVHLEADRRPFLANLFPRLGRYTGEGQRRSRGGFPRG